MIISLTEESLKDQEFESNTWPRRRRRQVQIEAIKEDSREEEEDVSLSNTSATVVDQEVNGPSASKVRRSLNPLMSSESRE